MPNNKRKMPHVDDAKINGRLDKKKFADHLPVANEAIASGDTAIHEVVIKVDHNGKPYVRVQRSHGHQKGLDPKISLKLQTVLAECIAEGLVADINEIPTGGDKDELVVQGA